MMFKMQKFIYILLIVLLLGATPHGVFADSPKAGNEKPSSASAQEHYAKGLAHQRLGERDKARAAFQMASAADPDFLPAHRAYITQVGPEKAESEYGEKLKKNPNSATLHIAMGTIHLLARDFDQAEKEFKQAGALDPNSPWLHFSMGRLLWRKQAPEDALTEYQKAAELGQNMAELHAALAEDFSRMKQFERARQESERTLKLNPARFEVYPLKWSAQLNLSQGAESTKTAIRKELEDVINANRTKADVLAMARQTYDSLLEDKAQAEKLKKRIKKIKPDWDEFGQYTSTRTDSSGNKIEIPGAVNKQIMDSFRNIEKNPIEAIKELKKAEAKTTDENVKRTAIYPQLVQAYVNAGDLNNAEKIAARIPTTDPKLRDRVDAMLAPAYADKKVNLDKALAIATASLEKRKEFKLEPKPKGMPDDLWQRFGSEEKQRERHKQAQSRAYDLLGWVQLQKGMLEEAEDNLSMSLELEHMESNTFHMAMLRKAQGQMRTALDLFIESYGYDGKKKEEAKKQAQAIHAALTGAKEDLETQLARAKDQVAALKTQRASTESESPKAPAVDFLLTNLAGAKVKLSDLRGKIVFLNFWATW